MDLHCYRESHLEACDPGLPQCWRGTLILFILPILFLPLFLSQRRWGTLLALLRKASIVSILLGVGACNMTFANCVCMCNETWAFLQAEDLKMPGRP